MAEHELKTDPEVFAAVLDGSKTHEIRFNDRDFKVGDKLRLRETRYSGDEMRCRPRPLEYTGRETTRIVSHVLSGYGLQPGWVVLSLAPRQLATESAGIRAYIQPRAPARTLDAAHSEVMEDIHAMSAAELRAHHESFRNGDIAKALGELRAVGDPSECAPVRRTSSARKNAVPTPERIREIAEQFFSDGTCDDDLIGFVQAVFKAIEERE
ncbi:DUF3850 domain-containing protein [Paraburkholderia sp. UCT31]|uniref:DUF3850 domain-containing protein n=1 Tax=Paraburkholderia sp. UCT31 TaxID=2615209 RepID=UPI0016565319|nr:DUF3850 domain-containing protein [Paraburkholderia sp. UCT31]MBC8741684.1 DUF3850 domain-containing protein [Paraburkholderia sp. UCT31]